MERTGNSISRKNRTSTKEQIQWDIKINRKKSGIKNKIDDSSPKEKIRKK